MGDFTKAVFNSKTIFEDEVFDKFEHCNSKDVCKYVYVDNVINFDRYEFRLYFYPRISKRKFTVLFTVCSEHVTPVPSSPSARYDRDSGD